jgi:glycosyltransferase involved in cell wall biosynthesis
MIAKDEEKYIEECLKRLLPYGMEIIVTDTGSTDRTKEIAARYADKVLDFEWNNDFSAARNFCASHASNNWILVLDCDEYVEKLDVRLMRIGMQRYSKRIGKLHLKNLAKRNNGADGYVYHDILRFYNKNYYEFVHPIHENLERKESVKGAIPEEEYFLLPIEAVHHGYNLSPEDMMKKQKRNVDMLRASLEVERGTDREPYIYYQLGQSYQVIGDIDASIEYYNKALDMEDNVRLEYIQTCITQLATAYAQKDDRQSALDVMEKYNGRIDTADFVYTYGLALLGVGEYLKALMQFVIVTTRDDKESLGEELLFCYRQILQLYDRFGQHELAKPFAEQYEYYQKSASL